MAIINFEDFPPKTRIRTQYSNRGVIFPNGAFLDSDPNARSGSRVLRAGDLSSEFHTGPLVIQFTSGQVRVKLFAGGSSQPIGGILRAFDAGGTLIAQDGPKVVTPNAFTTPFEITASGPVIFRLELDMEITAAAVFEAIDDLEFEGEAPPPPPPDPPTVTIDAPADNAELDATNVMVQGTVTGAGLLGTVSLRMQIGQPPGSTSPGINASVPLVGSGSTRTFALELVLGLGPHTVTVEAENAGGLKGSDSARFVNLPEAIRARHAAEGGSATFGALEYGTADGECKMAVYERGAIATGNGSTFIVQGSIFDKWFALKDSFGVPGRLGCPTSEARAVVAGAKAQDFERGRIVADLSTGSHYIPDVFVRAIDELGGEAANGVPTADPTDSIGVMQTWLFQQFVRPEHPQLLPSTFEIRGTPPKLWIERHGGDLSFFEGIPIVPKLPTLWQDFTCESNLGPCPIDLPVPRAPVQNAGVRFCKGKAWEDLGDDGQIVLLDAPPAWVAVVDDHELTPILGIVTKSRKAAKDHPQVHEYHGPPTKFPSDWNVFVRPLPEFRHLFAENDETLELEFEEYFAHAFFANPELGHPVRGDLLFASGRWVIDCGHRPFKSEIHPPAIMVHMRTAPNGPPTTEARIWVNGFYTGAPVDFDIYPPPRPSPDALLTIVKPRDTDAAFGIDIEFTAEPSIWANHVRVRLSAPARLNEVTGLGEMKWEPGRAYYGRWDISWSDG